MLPERKKKHDIEVDYVRVAESPAKRMLYVLKDHFWQLILANLLCVVFCLPVFTIPSGMAALHAVIQQYYRKGYGDVWPVFYEEFRTDFAERLFTGALPSVGALIVGLILLNVKSSWFTYIVMAVTIAAALMIYGWFFTQLPLLKVSPMQALKNALLLSALESGRSFFLMAVQIAFLTLMVFFLPVSLLAFFAPVPLIPALLVELISFPRIEKRLVRE